VYKLQEERRRRRSVCEGGEGAKESMTRERGVRERGVERVLLCKRKGWVGGEGAQHAAALSPCCFTAQPTAPSQPTPGPCLLHLPTAATTTAVSAAHPTLK
jgi:hypothetical protein